MAIGGWETSAVTDTKKARWFSIRVTRKNSPWLFAKGEPFRVVASIELLATTVALTVFGGSGAVPTGLAGGCSITGCTDNMSASYVVDRYVSTAFPLSAVLIWNSRACRMKFGSFSLENRFDVELESLPFIVLPRMMEAAESLLRARLIRVDQSLRLLLDQAMVSTEATVCAKPR